MLFRSMIGDLVVKELSIKDRQATAIWEVMTPSYSRYCLDFAVFVSYASDPVTNLPAVGTSTVDGSFAPARPYYHHNVSIPSFSSLQGGNRYNILTVVL